MDMPPQTITDPALNRSCCSPLLLQTRSRVTCSGGTCSHLWKAQGASGGPANSGVQWQMPIELHSAGQWAQGPLEDVAPQATLMKSVSEYLVRDILTCWRSFCRALAVLICTKEQIPVLLMGSGPSTALSSSPRVTACLLESPPYSWDCAGRHSKPSGNGTYWLPVQVSPHATNSDSQNRWVGERNVCGLHL